MGAISFNNKLYPVGGTASASMSVYYDMSPVTYSNFIVDIIYMPYDWT